MFTAEENQLLTRVGPGTPMGEVFRRYWLPAVLSEEIPEPDCPPVRTKLLGEALVAFRDTNGRPGLLAENCSHRRASLFYGRNEECGLRCIYHGWKYDVEGNILDTPAEPAESMLKHHVKHVAYPCQEVNGIVWTYMGPSKKMPPLPDLPWFTLPQDHVDVGSKFFLECSWLQCLDGDNDNMHAAYLHRRRRPLDQMRTRTGPPAGTVRGRCETVDLDFNQWGVRAATFYSMADPQTVWVHTNSFIMPCIGNTPRGSGDVNEAVHTIYQVPADDYSNWRYDFESYWDKTTDGSYGRHNRQEVGPGFRKIMNLQNDYLIDRARQRSGELYCGIDAGNHTQDACVTETMGAISDRTLENLGVSDTHIVEMRRYILRAIRDVQEGKDPPGIFFDPQENRIGNLCHMLTAAVPRGKDWRGLLPQV